MFNYTADEYRRWLEGNCSLCSKYEDESSNRDEAGCEIAFDLDTGMVTGFVRGSSKKIANAFVWKGCKCPYMQAGA